MSARLLGKDSSLSEKALSSYDTLLPINNLIDRSIFAQANFADDDPRNIISPKHTVEQILLFLARPNIFSLIRRPSNEFFLVVVKIYELENLFEQYHIVFLD